MTRRPPTTSWRGALIPLRTIGEALNPKPYIPTAGLAGIPPTAEATLHLVISGEAAICYTHSE